MFSLEFGSISCHARAAENDSIVESVLLVLVTAVATWFIMNRVRLKARPPKLLTHEEKEIGRARDIGTQLDGARDRASALGSTATSWRSLKP